MNRVVLSGRLDGRPKVAYTSDGIAVVHFLLLVPRDDPHAPGSPPPDAIPALAFRETAERLHLWGEAEARVTLEGRLRPAPRSEVPGSPPELQVLVSHAYFVDPVRERPLPSLLSRCEPGAEPGGAPERRRLS